MRRSFPLRAAHADTVHWKNVGQSSANPADAAFLKAGVAELLLR
jgi:hypothetical protein